MEPLSDLQLAEELIKQEMITMMHFDCLHHPSSSAASQLQRGKNRGPASTSNNASHIAYLEAHPYKPIVPEEMEQVPNTLRGKLCCSGGKKTVFVQTGLKDGFVPIIGKGPAGSRDGRGEGWNGSRRPQHGGLQPGVGGMLRTGKRCTAQERNF